LKIVITGLAIMVIVAVFTILAMSCGGPMEPASQTEGPMEPASQTEAPMEPASQTEGLQRAGMAPHGPMAEVAPSTWTCDWFDDFIGSPEGVKIHSYMVSHSDDIARGMEGVERKWTFSNTPTGAYHHIAASEETVAWLCASSGTYELMVRSDKGGAVKEYRVEVTVP